MIPVREKVQKALLTGAILLTSLTFSVAGFSQSFNLKVVAKVGDVIDGRTLTRLPYAFVDINDRGEIAFNARFIGPNGAPGEGIFTQDRLVVEVGQSLNGKTLTFLGGAFLNNNGDLIFTASFDGGNGVFTLGNGVYTTNELVVETGQVIAGLNILRFISSPVLNDLGEVVFHAATANSIPNESAIIKEGVVLASTDTPIDGRTPFNIVGGIDFNNAGDVIFVDVLLYPSTNRALMTPETVLMETGTEIDGVTVTAFRYPSLNNNRQVVFVGGLDIFGYDIETGTGELLFKMGTTIGGEVIALAGAPKLNDRGELAFFSVLSGSVRREALIASDEIVIKTGDLLDGKVVFRPGAFVSQNNRGDVAFAVDYSFTERVLVTASRDNDGDGIPDDEDDCPESDLDETVVIDGCDTGVTNELFADGCSLADIISNIVETCRDAAKNQGQAVSCISHETNELKKAGIISGSDKGAIQNCVN